MRSKQARVALVAVLTVLSVAAIQAIAQAEKPSRELTYTVADPVPSSALQEWTGDTATGANVEYDFSAGEPCHDTDGGADPEYCDLTLLKIDLSANPTAWDAQAGGIEIGVDTFNPPGQDFDLQVFASDANGNKGKLVGSSGAPAGNAERTTIREPADGSFYLIQVIYFAASGNYRGTLEAFARDRIPPDVDTPAGLQEIVASDANAGWTSRSEMHLGQDPVNPEVLIAGSKFYNKDPDALQEYEFKVGSYVSFNGGRGWTDLGQTNTCPASEAGPETWPNNDCYPAEDPNADGTGLEDATAGPGATVDAVPTGEEVSQGEHIAGTEFTQTEPLSAGSVGSFPVFLADDVDQSGCTWTTAVNSGIQEWIALAVRGGTCATFQAKFTAAQTAGADGLIMINTNDDQPVEPQPAATADIPGVLVKQTDGNRLKDSLQSGDPNAVKVTLQVPRGPDFGEEYITSDPWIQFDDEGNAYYMVLDAPPFTSGVGWGMSLHKWESVSQSDLGAGGQTWSNRIPINSYPNGFERDFLGFLDDKNTFAVNNAGPDGDGNTGTMIACWGQNVSAAIKQQIVCERSTDAGESWPNEPVPVSGEQQLVIGVHVIADKVNPDRFYAVWLQYTTTLATGQGTIAYSSTSDGGQTWTAPIHIGVIDDIPRTFPRQAFRNLSIPMMAVGPDPAGATPPPLYVVVSEYLPAPDTENDEDDLQADITMFKSTTGGATPADWSKSNITENTAAGTNTNADQFQPYVDVTESGQVNVFYFDRRHDQKTSSHPGNFFVDPYLSRSNDGGANWTHTRLSHDATDPELNAPVSGSGLFFGDYQGLVATDCVAIPFINDTHLANDTELDPGPVRDPEFDALLRTYEDAKYQQAVTWRVPNTTAFGGPAAGLPAGCPVDKPDLTLTSSDISASSTRIVRGRTYTLTAVVHNIGQAEAQNVVVKFREHRKLIGQHQTIASIQPGGTGTASVSWKPQTLGQRTITVVLDPKRQIAEERENNQRAKKTFTVRRR